MSGFHEERYRLACQNLCVGLGQFGCQPRQMSLQFVALRLECLPLCLGHCQAPGKRDIGLGG